MPKIFSPVDINSLEREQQKDYFDRHSPHVFCENTVKAGEKFKVKVVVGDQYQHPNDSDHYIGFIQLWDRETFLTEIKYGFGTMGSSPNQVEVDFYIVPKVSMNLTALSYCTKHGLWQSEPVFVKVNN